MLWTILVQWNILFYTLALFLRVPLQWKACPFWYNPRLLQIKVTRWGFQSFSRETWPSLIPSVKRKQFHSKLNQYCCIVRNRETGEYLQSGLSPRDYNGEEFLINAGELYTLIVTTEKKSWNIVRGQKSINSQKVIFEGHKH